MSKTKSKISNKFPTNKQLREAIQRLEESDILYRKYTPGFQGIDVKNIEVDKDYETKDEYVINYTATVHTLDESHTYYDCWVTYSDVKSFLK